MKGSALDPGEQQGVAPGPSGAGIRLLWLCQVPFGVLLAATGATMAVLTFSGSIGVGRRIFEVVLGVAVLASGALIAGAPALGKRTAGVHLAAGELALAATIVYLGETMPPFHLGAVGHDVALAQFVAVIAGLVLGSVALGLPAPAKLGEETSGVHWASVIRDSVILIVGTIVVAIGLTQLANKALMPPKWSWISFLGITIPGMLTLIFLRGPLKAVGRSGQAARQLAVEVLLIVGLSVMVFGSVTNLNLGKSGYVVGFRGNGTGLALWVAAAVFLLVVRGAVKLALPQGAAHAGAGVARKVLYVVGAVALIYGEKSVIMGKSPKVTIGAAAPVASLIVVAGLLILVLMRQAAKSMDPGGPLGPARADASLRSR
ncbi:MAG: hypothetical protein M3063_11680 [Actinomycetota bacterium]|nr:hypothetical protein [Actinomycetota bacterium]